MQQSGVKGEQQAKKGKMGQPRKHQMQFIFLGFKEGGPDMKFYGGTEANMGWY